MRLSLCSGSTLAASVTLCRRTAVSSISQALGVRIPFHGRPSSHRTTRASALKDDDDDDDDGAEAPGKPLRVERLLANLGYGKRKDCQKFVQRGQAVRKDGKKLKVGDKVLQKEILLDGEELDPPFPLVVMLNKPVGYVVTSPDDERIPDPKVYDLLPYRFGLRRPFLSSVGRLDKATSGLLVLTDDGQLVHSINSPKKGIWKVYEAMLGSPLQGNDAKAAIKRFASGAMMLAGDQHALLPAKLEMLSDTQARVSICEGRYHQVRRMFTAIGSEVIALRRVSVGGLSLDGLAESEWKYLSAADVEKLFNGPTTDEVMVQQVNTTAKNLQPTVQATAEPAAALDRAEGTGGVDEVEGSTQEVDVDSSMDPELMKMKEDERWRRRRKALKKMVTST